MSEQQSHYSEWTPETAIVANPEFVCPPEVLEKQRLLKVGYVDFDGADQQGDIVVHEDVANDVKEFFELATQLNFPIAKIVPAVAYGFSDDLMMADNNSSGFNYRKIVGTERLSNHSFGAAFDINPLQNPYTRYLADGTVITEPEGAVYDQSAPGTLTADHPLVQHMLERGWDWGGLWTPESGRTDYQHFSRITQG